MMVFNAIMLSYPIIIISVIISVITGSQYTERDTAGTDLGGGGWLPGPLLNANFEAKIFARGGDAKNEITFRVWRPSFYD